MRDIKGRMRRSCTKENCDCDEYSRERELNLCAYCEHTPFAHVLEDSAADDELSQPVKRLRTETTGCHVDCTDAASADCVAAVESDSDGRSVTPAPAAAAASVSPNEAVQKTPLCTGLFPQGLESVLSASAVESDSDGVEASLSASRSVTPAPAAAAGSVSPVQKTPLSTRLFPQGLVSVLSASADGLIVQSAGTLDYRLRCKLAGIVINHVIQHLGIQERPRNEHISEAADAIVAYFPNEYKETWYVNPSKSHRIAGGKLSEKLRNTWRQIKSATVSSSTDRLSSSSVGDDEDESVTDDINWLKYNTQPWTEVLAKWASTSQFRVQSFFSGQKSISSFPLLNNPKADCLMNIDFKTLCKSRAYGDCGNSLFQKWHTISGLLLQVGGKKASIPGGDAETNAFAALVSLTCSKRTLRLQRDAVRRNWSPTVKDSLDSFLLDAKDADDGDRHLKYLHDTYGPLKLTVQPLVMKIGASFIVAYNSYRWSYDSAVKAVDMCFKLTHVMNLAYNEASLPAWLFVQRYVYGFGTSYDTPAPRAAELASELGL